MRYLVAFVGIVELVTAAFGAPPRQAPRPPQYPGAPAVPANGGSDPYGVKDYAEFYQKVEIGPGVLVVGIADRFVGTYWVHCRVPSGFGGLADGEYLCKLEGGRHVIQPFKWSVDATPEVVAKSTFRQPGIPFNASHNCPVCGRAQYVISGSGPVAGSHTHTCAAGHTWWH